MKCTYVFKGRCLGSNKIDLEIEKFEFDGKDYTFFLPDETCKIIKADFITFLEIKN